MPARLGRYAVRRRIGSGGFATVWLAYDEQLDAPVAVKVLADNWTEDTYVRQRFLEEGRYLRRVESQHVVTVYDAGELDDGRPYLVMTYADQGTLADRLELGALTPGQGVEVIRQVADGLQALHDRGIVHRDIKPANVLFRSVAEGGPVRAMVADLGLGKAMDTSTRLTVIGGTPTYVAPEQAQGESPDARADQYSLAALAYQLLTGRTAYSHASLAAASAPSAPPAVEGLPEGVDEVIRRALSVDPDDRWPSVTAFATGLTRAMGTAEPELLAGPWLPVDPERTLPAKIAEPTGPVEPSRADRDPEPRRRALFAGLAAAVLLLGGVAGYLVSQLLVDTVTLEDDAGYLSVTVPVEWDRYVSTLGWRPPDETREYAAISAGTARDWTDQDSTANGVFVGLLAGDELPDQVPQHPECRNVREPSHDVDASGDELVTVVFTGCTGGVTVERIVRVTSNRLLWIQVRSDDMATANRVLDSVHTFGL